MRRPGQEQDANMAWYMFIIILNSIIIAKICH